MFKLKSSIKELPVNRDSLELLGKNKGFIVTGAIWDNKLFLDLENKNKPTPFLFKLFNYLNNEER